MTNIILIDLSSIAHQLFHVTANDPNPDATSIKTVERVRALASGQPHVAVCMDGPPYFRKDIDPAYKAQRDKENNAVIAHQIALAADALRADGFPVWQVTGFEADDLLATATTLALSSIIDPPIVDTRVTVCSSDKDLLQLVSDRVTFKSLTTGNDLDEAAVVAKFGVRPSQMRDYLTLVGDTSDNVQGCKGVGAKKAAELLGKCGNLEGIYGLLNAHGTQFTPALATNLREFEPRMPTVRALVTLRTDVPLPFEEVFRERVAADVASFGGEEPMADETLKWPTERSITDAEAGDIIKGAARGLSDPAPPFPFAPIDPMQQMAKAAEVVKESPFRVPPMQPMPAEPQGLVPAPLPFERQLEPVSLQGAKQLAADLFASRLFSAYGNAPAVLSTILAGRELGLQSMAALRSFHIIEGKPTLAADLIRALVIKSPSCEYFRCTERTAEKATFVTKRRGDPEIALTFTVAEGRAAWPKDDAAFAKSGWGRNPADMCVARASAKLARLVYPDVVHGFYAPEEVQ